MRNLELLAHARELAAPLVDVDGEADRLRLVGDGALAGLADPPCRIGRELEPLPPVELLGRAVETDDALLHEISERNTVPGVALCVVDDKTQVRVDHAFLRPVVTALDVLRELHLLRPL